MNAPLRFALAIALWFGATNLFAQNSAQDEAVYPHPESSLEYRITNRRYVSHITHELREERHYVTILMTHPGVWAFHSTPYAVHYECGSARDCLLLLRKLDDFLQSGWNIGLRLNGSEIKEIIFLVKP